MRKLRDTIAVPLAVPTIEAELPRFFEQYRQPDGTIVFPLRVPLRDFGLRDALTVERDVTVHLEKRRDAENINDELAISWEVVDPGPYPKFDVPLGAAGAFFDDAIGYLIASRTAHDLLESIRDGIIARQGTQTAGSET